MLDQPDPTYPTVDHLETPGASMREVLRMAWPAVISLASSTVMGFVDTLMVARVSELDLAAVTPAAILAFTVIALIDGLCTTNNTFVSQNFGARNYRECARYTWQYLYVAFALGVAVQVIQPFAADIFRLLGHEQRLQSREVDYFRYRLWGAGFFGMVVALAGFNQGISRPRISMVVALAANVLNIGLNYGLIYGRLGFPRMEIRGAALGTVIASGFQAFTLLAIFLSGPMHRRFQTRPALRLDFRRVGRILRVGAPVGLHFMADVASWAVFVGVLVGYFGRTAMAASNTVGQFIHLSWLPTVGLNIAATQLVGQWIGRGRLDIAQRRTYTALKVGMLYMATMGLLFFLLRRPMVSLFRPEEGVVEVGARIMVWAAIFQVFDAIGIVLYGALRGAGDTLVPALIVIGSAWLVFLPAGLAFSRGLGFGAPGAWMAAAVHLALIAGLLYLRFRSGRWRRLRLVESPPPGGGTLPPPVPPAGA